MKRHSTSCVLVFPPTPPCSGSHRTLGNGRVGSRYSRTVAVQHCRLSTGGRTRPRHSRAHLQRRDFDCCCKQHFSLCFSPHVCPAADPNLTPFKNISVLPEKMALIITRVFFVFFYLACVAVPAPVQPSNHTHTSR